MAKGLGPPSSERLQNTMLTRPRSARRFVVIPEGMPASSVLTKLLRLDMEARGPDAPPPRVITFVNDTEEATKLANPLRNALWEEHKIGLLLPDGEKPTATIHVRPFALL